MIILDTNILSELMRRAPDPTVELWLSNQPAADVFITAITEAELRYGVALLPRGRRQQALAEAVEATLVRDYREQILPFDSLAAVAFAEIMTFADVPGGRCCGRMGRSRQSPDPAPPGWPRATSRISRSAG